MSLDLGSPKDTSFHGDASIDVLCDKFNRPSEEQKIAEYINRGCAKSRMCGEETPKAIFIKFGVSIDIYDVITRANI